jgi:hypothetical protein
MKLVAHISLEIADMLKIPVNKELLYNAAMLNDIGFENFKEFKNDFDYIFGHQAKTKERLIDKGLKDIAEIASRHNAFGVNKKESILMGSEKGINLVPKAIESKIIAFADSFRPHFITRKDYWTIKSGYATEVFSKYGMIKKLENRKKRLGKFLIKSGMDYELLYNIFIKSENT